MGLFKSFISTEQLVESVDSMLGRLLFHFKQEDHNPADALKEEDLKELADQLAGLWIFAKDRAAFKKFRDFSKVDSTGFSLQFYKFLLDLDEPSQAKIFLNDSLTADELLAKIGQLFGKEKADNYLRVLTNMHNTRNVEISRRVIEADLNDLYSAYIDIMSKLRFHFSKKM